MRTIKEALEDGSLSLEDEIDYDDTPQAEEITWLKLEIEKLNNIINDLLDRQNEALRYIGNHLSLDSRYKHGNGDEELILVRKILNKHIKELEQGSDKE